jgi:hypothetical protein
MDTNAYLLIGALVFVVIVVVVSAFVVVKVPASGELETTKIRFAAATFTGLLALIVLIIVMYYSSPTGVGKDIFSVVFPAMNTLAGGIIGYIFGTKK